MFINAHFTSYIRTTYTFFIFSIEKWGQTRFTRTTRISGSRNAKILKGKSLFQNLALVSMNHALIMFTT